MENCPSTIIFAKGRSYSSQLFLPFNSQAQKLSALYGKARLYEQSRKRRNGMGQRYLHACVGILG